MVRSLGADHVLDYTPRGLRDGGLRYDVILDIGGNASLARLRQALAPEGTLVIAGGETSGRWLGGTDRQVRALVLSRFIGQTLKTFVAKENHEDLLVLKELIEAGKLTPAGRPRLSARRGAPGHRLPDRGPRPRQGRHHGLASRQRRCSTIRLESQITSRPSSTTGTWRWPVSASISSRSRAAQRDPHRLGLDPAPLELARHAAARAEPVRRRAAAVQARGHGTSSPSRRARVAGDPPAERLARARALRAARPRARGTRPRSPRRSPRAGACVQPELAPRLRRAVGPPVRGAADLDRRDRRRPGQRGRASRRARARPATGSCSAGASIAREPREVGEQAVPGVVAVAEDVALAGHAAARRRAGGRPPRRRRRRR